jgi:hypothetical protein
VDDLLVHARTFDELLSRIRPVLQCCREHNLKLNFKKSKFSMDLYILGHVISAAGIRADPKKVQAIFDTTAPTNIAELRSFLGMVNYVSKFVPDFANVRSQQSSMLGLTD